MVVNDVLGKQKAPNAHDQQKGIKGTKNISNFFTRSSRTNDLPLNNESLTTKRNHYMLEKEVE